VPIGACEHLTNLIGNLQQPLPRDVSLLIRDSFFCGFNAGTVSVCCPVDGLLDPSPDLRPTVADRGSCEMQQGVGAECVQYGECSPFVQMMINLKKPLHPAVPSMVRSSYLCGVEETETKRVPKICCPSEALAASSAPVPGRDSPTEEAQPETTTLEPRHRYLDHPARSLLASEASCGIANPLGRIVGGKDALIGQYPWLVNLGYTQEGRGGKPLFKCGGSLIGNRHVITAAHCVTELPRSFKLTVIRVGEWDLDQDIDCEGSVCAPPPVDIEVEDVIFHESYGKPKAFQNDIAVIKLSKNVTENLYVSPICLPYNDDDENYQVTGRLGASAPIIDVAGWGATTITGRKPATKLQTLEVSVTDSEECKEVYKERGGVLTNTQICAGGENGKDSCVGDSGSGLMRSTPDLARSNDRWDLIGVVSFGPRLCGTKGVPGVYSRVNSYLDWILDHVMEKS